MADPLIVYDLYRYNDDTDRLDHVSSTGIKRVAIRKALDNGWLINERPISEFAADHLPMPAWPNP